MNESGLGERCVHGIQLRRFPAPVRARGLAVRVVQRTGRAAVIDRPVEPDSAVDTVVRSLIRDGRAFGYSAPGQHPLTGRDAGAAVLFIPLTAHTGEYPRSINRVPVRLVRIPAPDREL